MSEVTIVGALDVAELVFYVFFLFFIGLVIYLRREDRREGYPLEEDSTGRVLPNEGLLQRASAKIFSMPHGRGDISPDANPRRDPTEVANARRAPWTGSPLDPVGDPMKAGIGPGSFVDRPDIPEIDMHGAPRIVPIGAAEAFYLAPHEPDLIGWPMVGADGRVAGTIDDIWVDISDHLIRYLSVATGTGSALVPYTMSRIRKDRRQVVCDAVTAAQFAGVPRPAKPGVVTLAEEDRITGYFGGGYLYATAERAEPLL